MNFDIILIIVNYRTYKDTIEYVTHIKNQKGVKIGFIIIDNDSPNNSYAYLEVEFKNDPYVFLVCSNKNVGYAQGNNLGIKEAEKYNYNGYIAISNNDIWFEDEYTLTKLIDKHNSLKHAGFIAPTMLINDKIAKHSAFKLPTLKDDIIDATYFLKKLINIDLYYHLRPDPQNKSSLIKVDCVSGAFFIGTMDLFKKIDLFDERTFLYEEERIIGKKVKHINKQNYIDTSLVYNHKVSSSISTSIDSYHRRKLVFKGRVIYYKYYSDTGKIGILLLKAFQYYTIIRLWIKYKILGPG
ncbi:MAG TPA: glycosyltransferase [Bacteroidales bacterium]|nr:glycosyltransferase [Bacteroidales bacterium]